MRKDIDDIKATLATREAGLPAGATHAKVPLAPVNTRMTLPFVPLRQRGSRDAKFVVVEFSDLQCPFCNHFRKTAYPTFLKNFVDTGKVRFIDVDFPLASHPAATRLALASDCADAQGKGDALTSKLIEEGAGTRDEDILATAKSVGIQNISNA